MFIRRYWIPISVFIVAIVGVGLYYLQTRPPKEPIMIYKPVEPLPKSTQQPTAEVSAGDTDTGGHVHADGTWHEKPHKTPPTASQRNYDRGAGNPPPFENLPVDLWDFEATKAAMIENINFVKANWDPKTFFDKDLGREMRIANAITGNIANATLLGIYTREQARELRVLRSSLLEFQGHKPGRVSELQEQGHTLKEAIRIAAEETAQRQGVK